MVHGLSRSEHGMWKRPRPGVEPVSPASADSYPLCQEGKPKVELKSDRTSCAVCASVPESSSCRERGDKDAAAAPAATRQTWPCPLEVH